MLQDGVVDIDSSDPTVADYSCIFSMFAVIKRARTDGASPTRAPRDEELPGELFVTAHTQRHGDQMSMILRTIFVQMPTPLARLCQTPQQSALGGRCRISCGHTMVSTLLLL
jgi:hypothetical protein